MQKQPGSGGPPWPKTNPNGTDIEDAEFEELIPAEHVPRLTYQGPSSENGDSANEDEVSMEEVLENIAASGGTGPAAMERTDLPDGASVRIDPAAKKPKSDRESGRHDRGRGGKKDKPIKDFSELGEALAAKASGASPVESEVVVPSFAQSSEAYGPHMPATLPPELNPTAEPFTLKEKKAELNSNLEEFKAMEAAGAEVEASKQAYFDALKAYQRSRGIGSITAGQFVEESAFTPASVKALRKEWVAKRAGYAAAQHESVRARLDTRPKTREEALENLERHKGKGGLDRNDVHERYNRMVTSRSVLLGAEEEELAARMEGLSARDKGSIEKALDAYNKHVPAGARVIITSAALFGGAALLTGGGALAGGAALAFGGAGVALKVLAEMQTNPKLKTFLGSIASVGALTGLVGQKAVELAHGALGTEKAAEATRTRRSSNVSALTTTAGLEKLSKERKSALTVKETIARQSRWGRILGSITGGALFGHLGHGTNAGSDHGDVAEHAPIGTDTAPHSAAEHAAPAAQAGAHQAPAAPAMPEALHVSTAGEGQHMEVGGEINTADKLIGHFREQLAREYPAGTTPPPAVEKLFEILKDRSQEDSATLQLGFQDAHGHSIDIHPGDTVKVEHGELVFMRAGSHESHVLIDAKGELHPMPAAPESSASVPAAEHAPVAPASSEVHAVPEAAATPVPSVPHVEVPVHAIPETHEIPGPTLSAHALPTERFDPAVPHDIRPIETRVGAAHEMPFGSHEPAAVHAEVPHTAQPEAAVAAHLNAHGVNLDKPDVSLAHGKYFAHGGSSNEENYQLAIRFARKMAPTQPGVPVYYVEEHVNILGITERTVRAISFDPSIDKMPVPHVVENGQILPVPAIPGPDDYEPVPNAR